MGDVRRGGRAWPARHAAAVLLTVTVAGLIAGGLLHLAGRADAADAAWFAVGGCGALYALWSMADSLRHRRIGVDVIALLAVAGALAVGEFLAAAVIGVMLASGRALEEWAAGRARQDLRMLLERAPRSARRRRGEAIETVPLDLIHPGDLLMVAPGDVVPVDGTVTGVSCVLDESALTGEPLPVERSPGEPVRSGVVNAGGPFDLLATATAADSTYSGIVRLVSEAEASQAPFVRLADRYALWFLLVTLAGAAAAWALGGAARAVAVLVVAAPCLSASPAAPRCCSTRPERSPAAVPPWPRPFPPGLCPPRRSCAWPPRSIRCPGTSWPPRSCARPWRGIAGSPCRPGPRRFPGTVSGESSTGTRSRSAPRASPGWPACRRGRSARGA